jgi:glyoxylase-like metal-dependent hydrolase (beta-lactamase superfamily II)
MQPASEHGGQSGRQGGNVASGVAEEQTGLFPAGDGPERIEEQLWRIPLPLPFALRAVNVYLIDEGPGARFLVDAGLGLEADEVALRAGLKAADVALEDITTLILTHAHPDHIGLADSICAASEAPVLMLEHEDERMYRVWGKDGEGLLAELEAMYITNGLPAEHHRSVRKSNATLRRILRLPSPAAIQSMHDGEELQLGAHTYQVIWTPGHSDYHACLLRDDGLLLVGDHVLPRITPNIGYYPEAARDPLGDYLASLERVAALDVRLTLPGHGYPFVDLAARARAIHDHHVERSAAIIGALEADPRGLTAGEIAGPLFGGRLRTGDDWRFAVSESLAHLEYLYARGRADRVIEAGLTRYALTG